MGVTQAEFRHALLDPAAPTPVGLADPEGRPAGKRFDVYRNNVVASLSGALSTGFPVIAKLLGPEQFRALAVAYSRAHPPRSPLMMHVGGDLPAFLNGFAPLSRFGYLADVARLELTLRESYHAADTKPLDPNTLASLGEDGLSRAVFRFAPSVRLVESSWPIVQIWRFNMENGPKPEPNGEAALVARPGFDPTIVTLDPVGARFVKALRAGTTLGAAAEAAAADAPGFDPSSVLGTLFAGHALTHVATDPDQGPAP
ncbi:MAG: DNA-binding domain-containing protein [Pseudomonadota bacterium]